VPDNSPEPADVYGVHPDVLLSGDAHADKLRRIVAVEKVRDLPAWIVLGRTTSDARPGDLHSPEEDGCKLDKVGWWSVRFKHTVETRRFGNPVYCPFFGMLSEPGRTDVLNYWEKVKWR
jgi:hypothetical protein